MIDIHSHILPGLDDGADTIEKSLDMIKLAASCGTTDLVATPHSNAQFRFNERKVEEAFRTMSKVSRGLITLYRGCDCHLTLENLEDALIRPSKYSINGGRYLLVELPDFMGPSTVWQQLRTLINARLCPIITHPERNISLQSSVKRLKEWVRHGCFVQVTAQAFLGRFGSDAQRSAECFMDAGLVHFVASDAHDCLDRPPDLSKAHARVSSRWGRARARRLFVENPAAVIADMPIDGDRQSRRTFRLFSFGRKSVSQYL